MAQSNWGPKLGGMAAVASLTMLLSSPVETVKKFSEWSPPVNLGGLVNSAFGDFLPAISKDGLRLYFTSNRSGNEDIWVSQRASHEDPWGPPVQLGSAVNTSFNERSPGLSRDEHYLFFATNRTDLPGGSGGFDIWVSWRPHIDDDFGWQLPVNLGDDVNSAFGDFGPTFFENDEVGIPILFFASGRSVPAGEGTNIYASELVLSGSFGPAFPIPELNTPFNDFRPTIRPDGLELFFDSNRPAPPDVSGVALRDLWVSTRQTVSGTWSPPEHVGSVVNSEVNDTLPALSSDGTTLIFSSDRSGGSGGDDLYMTTRVH